MFEILGEKTFTVADVPEDLAKKREKQAAKAEKKQEQATKPKKPNTAAQTKKIKKQLEGLDLAEKMVNDLLEHWRAFLKKCMRNWQKIWVVII